MSLYTFRCFDIHLLSYLLIIYLIFLLYINPVNLLSIYKLTLKQQVLNISKDATNMKDMKLSNRRIIHIHINRRVFYGRLTINKIPFDLLPFKFFFISKALYTCIVYRNLSYQQQDPLEQTYDLKEL